MKMQGLPYSQFPLGWFHIGWSDEFTVGKSIPLRYFATDLVAFRGESGALTVLDAHCPHMGAHLGFGGVVIEDTIQCPYHGWCWGSDGANVSIPGSRVNRGQRIRCWHVRENAGTALLWFHPDGKPPMWEVSDLVRSPAEFYPVFPEAARTWRSKLHPQVMVENAVDSGHFVYVHRAGRAPTLLQTEDLGPRFHVRQEIVYGADKPQTHLTPDGPVKGELDIDLWGVGLAMTRFAGSDDAYVLAAVTPVDSTFADLRITNWVPRGGDQSAALSESAQWRVTEQVKQAERDLIIWENMRYVDRPPLTKSEAKPYLALRRWSDRFYTDSPGYEAVTPRESRSA